MTGRRRDEKREWTVHNLEELRQALALIDASLQNLVLTYGVFVGLNRAALGTGISGPAVPSLQTIMFDQIQLMMFRINALTIPPNRTTDISLCTFREALASPDLMSALEASSRKWGMGVIPEQQAAAFQSRIAFVNKRIERLYSLDLKSISIFRNKAIAHITTEANSVQRPALKTIWRATKLSIAIGHDLNFVFGDGLNTDYIGMGKRARDSARSLVENVISSLKVDGAPR
ncbi:hypothetical protein V5F38_04340 [Xanthobacter sp. V0B-10]|uniref:hypothetical protein n=1 Tax=Xanthobacter albus TaxID=3119929 RepID=UPI00372C0189